MAMASIIDSYNKVLAPINAGYGKGAVDSTQIYSDPIGKAHQSAAQQEEMKRLEQESSRQLQLLLEQQQAALAAPPTVAPGSTSADLQAQAEHEARLQAQVQNQTQHEARLQAQGSQIVPAIAQAAQAAPAITRAAYGIANDQGASYLPYVTSGEKGSGTILFKGVPIKLPEGSSYITTSGPYQPSTKAFKGLTPEGAAQMQAAYNAAIGK